MEKISNLFDVRLAKVFQRKGLWQTHFFSVHIIFNYL